MIPAPRDVDDLIEVVRRTGAEMIMPRFRNLARGDIETKSGPRDLVTAADRAAEEAIREAAGSEPLGRDIAELAASRP